MLFRSDRALLAVLYGAGLRRSEVVQLDLGDYDPLHKTLRVLGKGNKERAVPLSSGVVALLEAWLACRTGAAGRLFLPLSRGGRVLFDTARGEPRGLTGQAVLVIVRKLAVRAGVVPFSPHDTRRTFISELLDAGADVSTVQQLVGHANVNTPVRYDRRGERAQRRAVERQHRQPLGGGDRARPPVRPAFPKRRQDCGSNAGFPVAGTPVPSE